MSCEVMFVSGRVVGFFSKLLVHTEGSQSRGNPPEVSLDSSTLKKLGSLAATAAERGEAFPSHM